MLAGEFDATISSYEQLSKCRDWKNKVYDFRLNHAARKIQKMVRKKFIAPYMELYKIIYSDVKKSEQQAKRWSLLFITSYC